MLHQAPRIGLTGSTGFIGKALFKDLNADYEVVALDLRKNSAAEMNLTNIQTVIHCAALVHQMQGAPREEYFRVNTKLTEDLAVRAKQQGVKHFVFLSTSHVYGELGNCFDHSARLRATAACNPIDPYGQSKLEAERILQSLQSEDFTVSILRVPMVYGEGAKGNLLSLCKLIKASPFLPFGEEKNRRSLIYIGNLVHFVRLTVQKKPAGILLPQDEKPLSIAEIVSYLSEATGRKVRLFKLPRPVFLALYKLRPNIFKRLYGTLAFDSENTIQILDYKAPISSKEGFRRMIQN